MTIEEDPLYAKIRARVHRSRTVDAVVDSQLLASFQQIVGQMHGERKSSDTELLDQVERVKEVLFTVTGMSTTASRFPGGSLVHRILRRLSARQVRGLAQQVQGLFVVQQQLIETLVARAIVAEQRETRLIGLLSQHVVDRLAVLESLERRMGGVEESLPEKGV